MTEQFIRQYRVTVGEIQFDSLDISFKVTKTLTEEPNTVELVIYNLNPDNRAALEQQQKVPVQIEAGYKDAMGVIFLGKVREVWSSYNPPNWVTTLSSGDGEDELQTSRVNKSYGPGTPVTVIIKDVAKGINIEIGNIPIVSPSATLLEATNVFLNGVVLSGPARREFDRLIKSAGLQWSVQDGAFQLLEAGKALIAEAVVITPDTGLIGSPTVGNDGTIKLRALLNSSIIPGKQLTVSCAGLSGFFRCEKVTFEGDSSGGSWYVDVEAKVLKI